MANRTVYEQATTGFTGATSPITLPNIANDWSWQIPSYIITAITNLCQFHGRDDKDAPAHINRITRLCSTVSIEGVNLDARYLQVLPFSLAGRAAVWFDSQPSGTFTTWAGLCDAFLVKYFPPAKHGLSDWALVENFYNGLTPEIKARFDTSVGGQLMGKKTINECNDLFESFAHSDMDYSTTSRTSILVRTSSATRGINQVRLDPSVVAAFESLKQELNEIKKKVDRCEVCRGGHDTIDCPTLTLEHVEFIANRGPTNPFNNSNYNSNWRSGGNNSGFHSSGNPPGFPSGQYQSRGAGLYTSSGSGNFVKTQEQLNKSQDLQLKNQQSTLLDLQRIVGGIAKQLQEHPPGQFLGNTFMNPANHSAKAITTRSGNSLGEVVRESEEVEDYEFDEEIEMEALGKVHMRLDPASTAHTEESLVEKNEEKQPTRIRPSPIVDPSRVPYPARLKHQKYAKEYGQFLEMFKQLKINLPFIEALQSMPKYAKFLKDLLKRKERIGELSNIPLTGGCSAVVLNKLPEKLTDPGTFTIPCLFGGAITPAHALADLGASINLMPFSLYERLGLGELTPTHMSLSLADRLIKYPRGIVENLLVKVDKFVFPVDFVVLDMEADERVPIILGRPFLRTAKAIINVFGGKISLRAGDEIVTFEIDRAMQHPGGRDEDTGPCHSIYFLNSFISCVDTCLEYISGADLVGEGVVDELDEEVEEEQLDESDELWVPEMFKLNEISSESTPVEIHHL
ncbi:uncharacterized protein LOC110906870 [Helianthus annuus]|uniref:uncharacterized protein LOC110906870 n=1 Tax=Helianthus annuus TaxID=4232 RepID=UPI000B8FC672|nr:uncharacterized protein LOC110906870 [Helianthus annuus]